jgi:hypothetical protein
MNADHKRLPKLAIESCRRASLDQLNRLRHVNCRWQRKKNVSVVVHAANREGLILFSRAIPPMKAQSRGCSTGLISLKRFLVENTQ